MLNLTRMLLLGAAAHLIFATVPGLDLWVSSLFYTPDGFGAAHSASLQTLRTVLWDFGILLCVLCLMMGLIHWRMGARLHLPAALWWRGALAFLLGPGLIINGIFKEFWGRARPVHITEFGGTHHFTPVFQLSDQCTSNCSFVSGEGGLAVMVALVLFSLIAPLLNPAGRRWLAGGLVGYAVVGSGLRIAMGGHFLSDTIFAALFCGLTWIALQRIPALRPGPVTVAAYAHDARLLAGIGARGLHHATRQIALAGAMAQRWLVKSLP